MSNSTDRLPTDTNPEVPRVIERGKTTITNPTAAGSYYYGTASVTLSNIASSQNADVDAHLWDGTNLYPFNHADYVGLSGSGGLRQMYWFTVANSGGVMQLNFNYYSQTQNESFTIYYVIYSNKISFASIL